MLTIAEEPACEREVEGGSRIPPNLADMICEQSQNTLSWLTIIVFIRLGWMSTRRTRIQRRGRRSCWPSSPRWPSPRLINGHWLNGQRWMGKFKLVEIWRQFELVQRGRLSKPAGRSEATLWAVSQNIRGLTLTLISSFHLSSLCHQRTPAFLIDFRHQNGPWWSLDWKNIILQIFM